MGQVVVGSRVPSSTSGPLAKADPTRDDFLDEALGVRLGNGVGTARTVRAALYTAIEGKSPAIRDKVGGPGDKGVVRPRAHGNNSWHG